MRLCLTCEERFLRTPDGAYWSAGPSGYSFTKRYLGAFDEVKVIARAKDVPAAQEGWSRADGHGVSFAPLPYYLGPLQYLRRLRQAGQMARAALGDKDALVMRVGSQIACTMRDKLRAGRPYGLEVIGDPLNVFAKGSTQHPLRPFWRWWFTRAQQDQCANASAVSYVTGGYLQRLYPCRKDAFSTSFLNMELGDDWFRKEPRSFAPWPKPFRIVTVGGLDQPYKGIDLLIQAVANCVTAGHDLELSIVGGGRLLDQLKAEAQAKGIGNRAVFHGSIGAGEPIKQELDRSHLFVLFSKTEGLPRAMIEAMGRALPCIGSDVGGIPELIDQSWIVRRGDVEMLTSKLKQVLSDASLLEAASANNLQRAKDYSEASLDQKRDEFLQYLKDKTTSWLSQRAA
jgi:glycosyltransferase involved in cell wall biosynthesis